MRKILVPVDGSENSERAIKLAITFGKQSPSIELFVLNVQLPIESGLVRDFISEEKINAFIADEGTRLFASARFLLDSAGARYTSAVATGPAGETIADYVKRERCDHVVMGTRGMGALKSLVVGSTAMRVIHLVDVPVTVVK